LPLSRQNEICKSCFFVKSAVDLNHMCNVSTLRVWPFFRRFEQLELRIIIAG
jgi:hypothetical protein